MGNELMTTAPKRAKPATADSGKTRNRL